MSTAFMYADVYIGHLVTCEQLYPPSSFTPQVLTGDLVGLPSMIEYRRVCEGLGEKRG